MPSPSAVRRRPRRVRRRQTPRAAVPTPNHARHRERASTLNRYVDAPMPQCCMAPSPDNRAQAPAGWWCWHHRFPGLSQAPCRRPGRCRRGRLRWRSRRRPPSSGWAVAPGTMPGRLRHTPGEVPLDSEKRPGHEGLFKRGSDELQNPGKVGHDPIGLHDDVAVHGQPAVGVDGADR